MLSYCYRANENNWFCLVAYFSFCEVVKRLLLRSLGIVSGGYNGGVVMLSFWVVLLTAMGWIRLFGVGSLLSLLLCLFIKSSRKPVMKPRRLDAYDYYGIFITLFWVDDDKPT